MSHEFSQFDHRQASLGILCWRDLAIENASGGAVLLHSVIELLPALLSEKLNDNVVPLKFLTAPITQQLIQVSIVNAASLFELSLL
jgi:hypothetical protein